MRRAEIFVDGASSGNPGPSGIAFEIRLGDRRISESRHIGWATNNQAEYLALIAALRRARELGVQEVRIYSDSQLLVNQVLGLYKVRAGRIKELHREVMGLLGSFRKWVIRHIPRDQNMRVDRLAKEAAHHA